MRLFYLKYTLGKGKLCLQRLKKVRLLQYLGVSDVNTIKRRNSNPCVMRLMIAYFSSTLVCLVSFKQGRFEA